jgi:hypothetical protein
MGAEPLRFEIRTKGLTLKEQREFRAMLESSGEVKTVSDAPFTGSIYASIGEFHLIVELAKHAVEAAAAFIVADAAHSFVKKCAELLAEDFAKWWRSKSPGTSSIPVDVTIYGPDDKPVKVVRVMR